MNKKIKIIDLLNKIANGDYPKRFKYNDKIYEYKRIIQGTGYVTDGYDWFNSDIYIDDWENLNAYVEILEDNTEGIEELEFTLEANDFTAHQLQYFYKMNCKINELGKEINQIRKEKE